MRKIPFRVFSPTCRQLGNQSKGMEAKSPPIVASLSLGQGSQFTGLEFTQMLKEAGASISMDGKGRWMDNVFIERLCDR